jgi:CheY-like chemotaxis protein
MIPVLLVEDNPADVLIARIALSESGIPCEVHVAADGSEALDFLHRRGQFKDAPKPRLIILDWNLPKVSGGEVLATLKSDRDLHLIPVVIYSSSAARPDVDRGYDLRANCWVVKAIDLDTQLKNIAGLMSFWFNTAEVPCAG